MNLACCGGPPPGGPAAMGELPPSEFANTRGRGSPTSSAGASDPFASPAVAAPAPAPQQSTWSSSIWASKPAETPLASPKKSPKALPRHEQFSATGETASFCCMFFCYLSVIPFLFVFAYHAFPTTILGIIATFALCSFIPCMFNSGDTVVAEPVGPLLSAAMLACTLVAFMGSMHMYYAHVQPLRALVLTREYGGVYPQQPSITVSDAAFLKFAGNTSVDVSNAVAMQSLDAGLSTFCVAPVTSPENTGRVEFWAVGENCCGKAGEKFDCDDAGQAGAKNAFIMQNPTDALFNKIGKYLAPPIYRRDLFLQAIAKAEHTKGLVSTKEPLLVRWTKMTKDEVIKYEAVNIAMTIVVSQALSVVMALFLTRIVHRFGQLRKEHRRQTCGDEGGDVTARLSEFLHSMDDHFDDAQNTFGDMDLAKFKPPLSRVDMCIWGVTIPYVVMMLCVLLTSYTGCMRNGQLVHAPFMTILFIAIVSLLSTPSRVVTGLFMFLVATVGLYIGHENYMNNMFHYCTIEDRRTYTMVPPTSTSDTYRDAGILEFGPNSRLSQNHSVGFLYKDVTYCVAPILAYADHCAEEQKVAKKGSTSADKVSFLQRTSRMQTSLDTDDDNDADDDGAADDSGGASALQTSHAVPPDCKTLPAPKRIEYWAIGINCCGARKDFRCDGGKDKNAHSAVIVRTTGREEPGDARDQFFNAISQSVAAYGLPVPEKPVLIRWGEDAEVLQRTWKTTATGVILLTAMIGLLSILIIGFGSFFYMKRMRQRELAEEAEAEAKREAAQRQATAQAGSSGGLSGMFSKARESLRV